MHADCTTDAPTATLGLDVLQRHALAATLADLAILEGRLVDLKTRAWECQKHGVTLPATLPELNVVHAAVRELAGRVRAEQGG